jgi:hypothetical protein
MNAAVKSCGSCEHSTPSTVENMTGFVWCKKREEAGGTMEAVFYNPEWQRQCAAFTDINLTGRLIEPSPFYDEKGLLPSTMALTASIPMAMPQVRALVQPTQSVSQVRKKIQTSDLFPDLFM